MPSEIVDQKLHARERLQGLFEQSHLLNMSRRIWHTRHTSTQAA